MNFNGVFDEWNYMKYPNEDYEEFMRFTSVRLNQSEVDEAKAWVYKPQFMDYVVRGMSNFLKSPFKS